MRHLDDNLLLMILNGRMQPRALLQAMYDHLRDLCPECRANLELVAGEAGWSLADAAAAPASPALPTVHDGDDVPHVPDAVAAPAGQDYSSAFETASTQAILCAAQLAAERRQAEVTLEELRALPAAERPGHLASAHFGAHLGSRALAERLLEECRQVVRREPDEALSLAELVPAILDLIPGSHDRTWAEELLARALAHRGNALRVAGEMAAAESTYLALRRYLTEHSLELEDLHPEVASLEASLRYEQGRFQDAIELLDVAARLAQVAGDTEELCRFLVKRGDVHRYNGGLAEARRDLEQALSLLDADAEPELFMCAVGNYCIYLCDSGAHDEAARVLDHHRALFDREDDPWVRLRETSLRGFIAHGRGDVETAERLYLEARDGFVANDLPFRGALLSLELARLYLEQGRHRDLAELASWMGKVFESRELPARATVALMLFQQAVAAEQVTVEALQGLRVCLEQARASTRRAPALPS